MRASYIWAFLILVAITGWLASGEIIVGGQSDTGAPPPERAEPAQAATGEAGEGVPEEAPFRVSVRTVSAVERAAELSVRGQTEAAQRVTVRAQTSGLVEELPIAKGQRVSAGDVVCRIEAGSREARLLQAKASLAQAELDHNAAATLQERGHGAETRVRAARAALDAASAALAEAQLDLTRTTIRAPFDGIVKARPAEIGALLNVGDACAEIVASDPMLVVAQVSERDVGKIETGMAGTARLVTGQEVDGTVSYVAPSADLATRTFRVELEVANPEGRLRDGVTAEIALQLESTRAHRLAPSVLTLDNDGRIGVRTIGDGNRTEFLPVEVLADERGGVWVAGLPDRVTVITVGQDYVVDGELVEPVVETAEAAQ